ncbi:hypothetical protein KFZ58_02725 [Virgibacillus sp. NKC19-16]|uniref:hypothetical protein n=1 Tax=Virgibacillus salidurans TaxID=2831673 RepID=UPI001F2447D3|nr:hypothetical protein [Virgibacillus sp. NKC19-16]UJL46880.1 hypothetical protein KFZ58_02725 [Virgibacillus sp. NKC19-16]
MNKVLLADDEQRMLDLLALYLKLYDYTYKQALGGRNTGFPIDQHLKTVWGVGYKWIKKSLIL